MFFSVNFFSSSVFNMFRSFLKRCFVFLLAIIIAFNFICKPKETHALALSTILTIVSIVGGIVGTGKIVYDIWKEEHKEEDDFETYFSKHITVNGDGNYIIDAEGMVTINEMKKLQEQEDSYTYGYFLKSSNLGTGGFSKKSSRDICVSLIQGNPGYLFYIAGHAWGTDSTGAQVNCIRVNIFPVPYGGVGPNPPCFMIGSAANFYSEEWSSTFEYRTVYIYDHNESDPRTGMYYVDSGGTRYEFADASEVLRDFKASDVPVAGREITQSIVYSSRRDLSQVTLDYKGGRVFTDYAGGFPIFNSLAALKKGLSDCTEAQYMPGYQPGTEITKNTITQQDIEDYSTTYNYYYGNGSGDDPSGNNPGGSGSGSGGGWIDSIVNGIMSFFDGLLQIIGTFIEAAGKLVGLLTGAFADVLEIVPEGFAGLLAQLFPAVPQEWITAATLFIVFAVLGILIKIFK